MVHHGAEQGLPSARRHGANWNVGYPVQGLRFPALSSAWTLHSQSARFVSMTKDPQEVCV